MSSVEAARHAGAALRAVGESSPANPGGSRSAGLNQNNTSEAFASLFDSARLNFGRKPDASSNRPSAPTTNSDSDRSDAARDDRKDAQAASSEPANPTAKTGQAAPSKRAKTTANERKRDTASARSEKSSSRDASTPPSSQDSSSVDSESDTPSAQSCGQTDSDAGTPHRPAPSDGSTGAPVSSPSPTTGAVNPLLIPGMQSAPPLPGFASGSGVSDAGSGATGSSPASNIQNGAASTLTAALKPITGTQSAEGTGEVEQKAPAEGGSKGEGANTASAGGSFDHVLQTAARTKAQLAGKMDALGNAKESSETVQPEETAGIEKLARVIQSSGRDGQNKMLIQLDPPELGKLQIDVRMKDQTLTVRMEAQTQAGHDALASRLTDLKSALEQQGIHVQRMDVEIRPPHGPSPQEQPASQQHSSQGDAGSYGQPQQRGGTGRDSGHAPGGETNQWNGGVSGSVEAAQAAESSGYSRGLNLVA